MTDKPKFNFTKNSVTLSEEEFLQEAAKSKNKGKFLNVGVHVVEITDAGFHNTKATGDMWLAKDPTWFLTKLTLTAAEKSKDLYLCVPTSKIEFGGPDSKNPLGLFLKFRQFMAAIGEEITVDSKVLQKSLSKYFADPTKLIGKRLQIEIKYTFPHVKWVGENAFKIANGDGSDHTILTETYTSRDAAIAACAEVGIKPQAFPEITSFTAVEQVKEKEEEEDTNDDW
jgi:hypothetical protein